MSKNHHRSGVAAKLRKWRPQVAATLPAPCVNRCQLDGIVRPGQVWDVAHLPGRDAYLMQAGHPVTRNDVGAAHAKCNRSDGGKIGAAITNSKRLVESRRRAW